MTNVRSYVYSLKWIEVLLCLAIAVGIGRAIFFVSAYGYLPQPYFYDANDPWMDWFNTADWSRDIGMYDSWGTVYPPLSFVVLRVFGLSHCYEGGAWFDNSYYARSCDWVGAVAVHAIYLACVIACSVALYRTDKSTALLRSFALAAGLPLTSALERGNLLLLAFLFMVLAHAPILRSARLRWVSIGMAINFKIYVIATLFSQLLRRRWRWFEGGLAATLIIYLLAFGILGRGTPIEVYQNIINFQADQGPSRFLDLFNQATYSPMVALFEAHAGTVAGFIGSKNVDLALFVLPILLRITQAAIIAAVIAIWLRPEVVPMHRINNLAICFALVTVESGNYTHLLPVFFTFFEKWRGIGPKVSIICCYLLSIPFDFALDRTVPLVHNTFYNNSTTFITYYVLLGPFIKPLIFYIVPVGIACSTIAAVWRDVRDKGLQSRQRFAREAPILV